MILIVHISESRMLLSRHDSLVSGSSISFSDFSQNSYVDDISLVWYVL